MHGPMLGHHRISCATISVPREFAAVAAATALDFGAGCVGVCANTRLDNPLAIGRVHGRVLIAVEHDGRWCAR